MAGKQAHYQIAESKGTCLSLATSARTPATPIRLPPQLQARREQMMSLGRAWAANGPSTRAYSRVARAGQWIKPSARALAPASLIRLEETLAMPQSGRSRSGIAKAQQVLGQHRQGQAGAGAGAAETRAGGTGAAGAGAAGTGAGRTGVTGAGGGGGIVVIAYNSVYSAGTYNTLGGIGGTCSSCASNGGRGGNSSGNAVLGQIDEMEYKALKDICKQIIITTVSKFYDPSDSLCLTTYKQNIFNHLSEAGTAAAQKILQEYENVKWSYPDILSI